MQINIYNPLEKSVVDRHNKINNVFSLAYLLMDWFVILGLIALSEALSESFWHPLLYVIVVMAIANRQHSLTIQMHDSAHSRLFSNRRFNEVAGEVLCAWPLFFRMAAYRENHLAHHKYPNTPKDPDFRRERFPESRREIYWMLITDALGINTVQQLGELKRLKKSNVPVKTQIARVAYYLTVIAVLTYFHLWTLYLMYWIVPIFTWLKVVLRLRAIADHSGKGVYDQEHPFNTRTIVPNFFDRIFLAPRSCSYHLGHHLYAGVPSYNLKALHKDLMKIDAFRARCRITHGFWRLLLEFPATFKESPSNPGTGALNVSKPIL